jgi:hypothetical protein
VARILVSLISLLSALAVLICVAVAVVWVRSYFTADLAVLTAGVHAVSAHSSTGGVIVVHARGPRRLPTSFDWDPQPRKAMGADGWLGPLFTFDAKDMNGEADGGDRLLAFPHWAVVAAGLFPAAWLETRRRIRRRRTTSHCVKCGMLLHGSQGMCPRCRTPAGGFIA